MSGSFDLGGLTITWNRLWIVVFAIVVFVILLLVLNRTALGLQMRAVTQNRRMASAMGIRTPFVDAMTFGLGSGIAGHRRRGAEPDRQRLAQPRPGLHHRQLHGRGLRRRRQPLGHADRRADAGHRQQVPRALCRRGARQDPDPRADHPLHPAPAARPVRPQGPGGGSNDHPVRSSAPSTGRRSGSSSSLLVVAIAVPASQPAAAGRPVRCTCRTTPCRCSASTSTTPCWRSPSTWSGATAASSRSATRAFFALGGYAMGMYLMRQIGDRGVYANPVLPDFMVFLNYKELPWFWYGFDMFWFAVAHGGAGAGAARLRLRLVRLPQPRHRRLSLDHHPGDDLRPAARLLPQRLRLRRQQRPHRLQGHPRLQRPGARRRAPALFAASAIALALAVLVCSAIVNSKLGKVMVAIRDAESRTRFLGYRVGGREALRLRRVGGASPASPGRSTCRRSASSTRASSRPRTRSRR